MESANDSNAQVAMNKPVAICFCLLLSAISSAEECVPANSSLVSTDHFFFSVSSAAGAVGDVVGVDLSLTVEDTQLQVEGQQVNLFGFGLAGCYDGSLELLDAVRYSDFFDEFAFLSSFYPEGGEAGRLPQHPGGTFLLYSGIRRGAVERFLLPNRAFPLATLYFRVTGTPGAEVEVRPCENTVAGGVCAFNYLQYAIVGSRRELLTRSDRHVRGTIRILPGEPTLPDPPPVPTLAKIYPEAPTPESAAIRFEIEGPLVAVPGDTDLPMRLYATSNYEFSGFMTALRFPPEHLQLNRVEEHTRPGITLVDNTAGGFGILMSNSRRRVGQEGERVHLATLHFSVADAARGAGEVDIRFERFDNFLNWLAIHSRQGVTDDSLPITTEVTPLLVGDALLKIQAEPSRLGDVNLDYELDLSDTLALLGGLFGGKPVLCPEASDFNQDGSTDISDPIAILNWLFRAWPAPAERAILCNTASG